MFSFKIFLRDRQAGTTELISVNSAGQRPDPPTGSLDPAISADGNLVAFTSGADNFDGSTATGIFLRNRSAGTTERVSLTSTGAPNTVSPSQPDICADGNVVVFSTPEALVPEDTNADGNLQDLYARNRSAGTTTRESVSTSGGQGNGRISGIEGSISADGTVVAFASNATDLVPDDTNGVLDVFAHVVDGTATTPPRCPTPPPPRWPRRPPRWPRPPPRWRSRPPARPPPRWRPRVGATHRAVR